MGIIMAVNSRNEFFYDMLKTELLKFTGTTLMETYEENPSKFPYIYLEIGDESTDYNETEGHDSYFNNGQCYFEIYYGENIKTDKNINATIRPKIFLALDKIENLILKTTLPKKYTHVESSTNIYELTVESIRMLDNKKAYGDNRTEILLTGIIIFLKTYL